MERFLKLRAFVPANRLARNFGRFSFSAFIFCPGVSQRFASYLHVPLGETFRFSCGELHLAGSQLKSLLLCG